MTALWARRGANLLVVAFGLALYLPGLGIELLRHPLEAKYALAARAMLQGGPLLVAHLFGELYPDKPPLYFWATALFGWVSGGQITEVTARLPAVMGALGGLLLVHRLGTDLFGPRAGLVSALILATSGLFFWYARQGHPDQFLTTFVTLACLGLWRSLAAPGTGRAMAWTVVAYAAMALGVMSKGLIGLIVPLLAGATYLALARPLRAVPHGLRLWPGLPVFLAVVLAWYAPAVAQNGSSYLYETVVHQQLVRYAQSWVHRGPWYYYFGEFTSGFFPWSLFVPGALVLAWRARRGERADPPDEPIETPVLFPLAWLVTGFVFFSLSASKRSAYLLPVYPAAALLVGWLWDRTLDAGKRSRWVGVPLAVLSGAAALLAATLLVLPRRLIPGRMVDTMVPARPWALAGLVAVVLIGAAAVWLSWRRGRPALALGFLVGVQAVLLVSVALVRAPQYEARYPARALAARVEAAVPAGQQVLSLLDDYNFIVAFYLDRPVVLLANPGEVLAARKADGPRYALVDPEDASILQAPGVDRLAEGQLGPKHIVLIRLAPLPS